MHSVVIIICACYILQDCSMPPSPLCMLVGGQKVFVGGAFNSHPSPSLPARESRSKASESCALAPLFSSTLLWAGSVVLASCCILASSLSNSSYLGEAARMGEHNASAQRARRLPDISSHFPLSHIHSPPLHPALSLFMLGEEQ